MAKKYIDADRLKAEIERRNLTNYCGTAEQYEEELFAIIDSLQQEQPSEDLEAEMEKYFDGWNDDPEYGQAVLPHTYECVGVSDCKDIARHFYELGKQSKEPVNEDLEAEIKRYVASLPESATVDPFEGYPTLEDVARHFAEWGAEHLRDTTKMIDKSLEEAAENIYKTPSGTRAEDFIAGAEWAMRYQEKKIADAYEKGKQEGVRVVRSWESSPGQGGY